MTVAELINELSKLDDESMVVRIQIDGYREITDFIMVEDGDVILS